MKLEKFLTAIQILRYIDDNPKCIVPSIRDFLKIIHSEPPTQEEKDLYKIISSLSAQGMIEKRPIKNREPGGAHFYLIIREEGRNFVDQTGYSQKNEFISPRSENIEKLEASLRLAIRNTLSGKVSKPQMVELVGALSNAILREIESIRK